MLHLKNFLSEMAVTVIGVTLTTTKNTFRHLRDKLTVALFD